MCSDYMSPPEFPFWIKGYVSAGDESTCFDVYNEEYLMDMLSQLREEKP